MRKIFLFSFFFLYSFFSTFSQSDSSLSLIWDSDVGCQVTAGDEDKGFGEEIANSECVRVCENSNIEYRLSGDLSDVADIFWSVTGGNVLSPTTNDISCQVQWIYTPLTNMGFINVEILFNDGHVEIIDECFIKLKVPEVNFHIYNKPKSVCVESEIVFVNETTPNDGHATLYYNWDFGDKTYSNEMNPEHIYHNPGIYKVSLTVFNGCNCSETRVMEIEVVDYKIQIECPSIVCENTVAKYTISDELFECDIKWEVEGGTIVSPDNEPKVFINWDNVDNTGFGFVSVSAFECVDCTSTVRIPVIKEEIEIVGDNVICVGEQTLYSLPQWPSTEFNWSITGGAQLLKTINRNEILVQASVPGTYVLTANYTNTVMGCGGQTFDKIIEVQPAVEVSEYQDICEHDPFIVTFTPSSSDILWEVFDNNSHTYSGNGDINIPAINDHGTYYIITTSSDFCIPYLKPFRVKETPDAPDDIFGNTEICPTQPETYSCDVPDGVVAHWEVVGGSIVGSDIGESILVNFDSSASVYQVKVYFEKDSCPSDEFVLDVEREGLPPIPIQPAISTSTSVYEGCKISYSLDTTVSDFESIVWSLAPSSAGAIVSGQNSENVKIIWYQSGNLNVTVSKCDASVTSDIGQVVESPSYTIVSTSCNDYPDGVEFSIAPAPSSATITWDFGDGITSSGTLNPVYHHYDMGNIREEYTVTAIISNSVSGCEVVVHSTVTVTDFDVNIMPNNSQICQDSTESTFFYVDGADVGDTITWEDSSGNTIASDFSSCWISNSVLSDGVCTVTIERDGCSTKVFNIEVEIVDCDGGGIGTSLPDNYCGITNGDIIFGIENCTDVSLFYDGLSFTPSDTNWFIKREGGNYQSYHMDTFHDNLSVGRYYAVVLLKDNDCWYQIPEIDPSSGNYGYEFLVPFNAGLDYTIDCLGSDYFVTFEDISTYYSDSTIDYSTISTVEYIITNDDTGISFTSSTGSVSLIGGYHYTFSISVSSPGYSHCYNTSQVYLPDLAPGTIDVTNTCGVYEFNIVNPNPNLYYTWYFGDGDSGEGQLPITHAYLASGSYDAGVIIGSRYSDCEEFFPIDIDVNISQIDAELNPVPSQACEGSSVNLSYTVTSSTVDVDTVNWYQNSLSTLYQTTTGTNHNINVTESGTYFVVAKDTNGCKDYDTNTVQVLFTPTPEVPEISGPNFVCPGSDAVFTTPESNNGLEYIWSIDGSLASGVTGNELMVTPYSLGVGTHVVKAIATIDGCESDSFAHYFEVVELETPTFYYEVSKCEPYTVYAYITNHQAGVNYIWSNGIQGEEMEITHDGPINVTAYLGNCSVSSVSQELPIDLTKLDWTFPKGCYYTCKSIPYIIGPYGEYEDWAWYENNNIMLSGSGEIEPYTEIYPVNNYSMYLVNEAGCEREYELMRVFEKENCPNCDAEIDSKCNVQSDGYYLFVEYNTPIDLFNVEFLSLYGSIPGTYSMPSGSGLLQLDFFPNSGFYPGMVEISASANFYDGSYLDSCTHDFMVSFDPCGKESKEKQVLQLIPNPSKESTTILYDVKYDGAMTLVVSDMMDVDYLKTNLDSNKGDVLFNTSSLKTGVYRVCLFAEDGELITMDKLIVEE